MRIGGSLGRSSHTAGSIFAFPESQESALCKTHVSFFFYVCECEWHPHKRACPFPSLVGCWRLDRRIVGAVGSTVLPQVSDAIECNV